MVMEGPWYVRIKIGCLLFIPFLVWSVNYHASDQDFSFCLFHLLTGHHCYGCGLLRGLSATLHGDFKAAYALNRLNLISIPLITFVYTREWARVISTRRALGPRRAPEAGTQ
jgi:hypothetical protein